MVKNCRTCKHKNRKIDDMPCCECTRHRITGEFSLYYPSDPLTNADRIRAMSDEELAEFLNYTEINARYFCLTGKDGLLQWLQSPVEGGEDDNATIG